MNAPGRSLAIEDEGVNGCQIPSLDHGVEGLLPTRTMLRASEMMNDADERTADSILQPPIDHEERGMIQLILEKDIQSGGFNSCNEIAAEIVQEMSWIGAPGKREDLDIRAPFTER